MRFVVITHAVHTSKAGKLYSYGPYVREMNLWTKHVSTIEIVAPASQEKINTIDIAYHKSTEFTAIPNFNITTVKNIFKALFSIPTIMYVIYKAMNRADHIHLRCPGNVGLLGCVVQILFPNIPKTVKYAGNWDPKSKQPLSYKVQQWILRNTLLTKNVKVLVYGDWKETSKNIIPFFTASYSENEKKPIENKKF